MRELDVRLEQDVNYAAVDLFNTNHASRVLRWMGRAMGRLPQTLSQMTDDQSDFVRRVVSELSEKNLVSPVRLAVFAEMVRDKPWTASTLEQLGGVEGGGVAFLEDCFGRKSIHADYLRHSKAAAAILKSLLPELTSNIKGRMQPVKDLITISGYASRPSDFHELRRILDTELRIISPTDPDGHSDQSAQQVKLQCYQLTTIFLSRPFANGFVVSNWRQLKGVRNCDLRKQPRFGWRTQRRATCHHLPSGSPSCAGLLQGSGQSQNAD